MAEVVGAVEAATSTVSSSSSQSLSTSLRVGNLDDSVTDSHLYEHFQEVANVILVRICKNRQTGLSLGYGYVNFICFDDAQMAMEKLKFSHINGKPIRVTYAFNSRERGSANIFVKNLDKSMEIKGLYNTFSKFGTIISCKIATNSLGQSKGYGFVQFRDEYSAEIAIRRVNGTSINNKQVYVGHYLDKQARESASRTEFKNVYVKNLSSSTDEEELMKIFGEYGAISSAIVMRDDQGKSKCFGFVNFECHEYAVRAIEALNGRMFDGKPWYVNKAQKKAERVKELKLRLEQIQKDGEFCWTWKVTSLPFQI